MNNQSYYYTREKAYPSPQPLDRNQQTPSHQSLHPSQANPQSQSRNPPPPPPPKKKKFDIKKYKTNTLKSLNEVENFLHNIKKITNSIKLYKILK